VTLGDFDLCVGQFGRFRRSTENDDGHVLGVGVDRGDDPPLSRTRDDLSDVRHGCGLTPFATAVAVLEQKAFDSHAGHGGEKESIGCLQRYRDPVPRQIGGLEQTFGASANARLERVSERSQRDRAVAEDRKDRVLLVRGEFHLAPLRVEGKADVVGQPSLAGALKTTCEHRDSARRQDHTGDEHFNWLLPPLSSSQTA
jgi:hypothetical protein